MAAATTLDRANEILDDEALAEEKLLEELENEEIPSHLREARLQSLKNEAEQFKMMKQKSHGMYTEIMEEKQFLDMTTSEDRCVVHFFHSDFRRCAIMDTHLEKLSKTYFETKFSKINVDNAKFFVEKLKIRMLPALICFNKGIVCDRVIGFEELGNTDSFQTMLLEKRLGKSGVIDIPEEFKTKKTIFGHSKMHTNDDSSDDDD
ncbi:phosducin-like protein 3 [Pecten maximus]|uniref:phosducin-like protein 3 n=1 Tax=Pecten maximus TaxID=6579 RepID=UPI001458BA6D|nr:phosducin-like protein 3 [Pecten maximus]